MRHASLFGAAVIALGAYAAGALLAVAPAEAKPVTTSGLATCLEFGGIVEQPPSSSLAACCIDQKVDPTGVAERGCYICNSDWTDCVWEPAFSRLQTHGVGAVLQGTLAPAGTKPRLPVARQPGALAPQ